MFLSISPQTNTDIHIRELPPTPPTAVRRQSRGPLAGDKRKSRKSAKLTPSPVRSGASVPSSHNPSDGLQAKLSGKPPVGKVASSAKRPRYLPALPGQAKPVTEDSATPQSTPSPRTDAAQTSQEEFEARQARARRRRRQEQARQRGLGRSSPDSEERSASPFPSGPVRSESSSPDVDRARSNSDFTPASLGLGDDGQHAVLYKTKSDTNLMAGQQGISLQGGKEAAHSDG